MRKVFLFLTIVVFVLFATAPCFAAEMYGCEKKNGKLRIVTDLSECKGSETPIIWDVGPGDIACAPGFAMAGIINDEPDCFRVVVQAECRWTVEGICGELALCGLHTGAPCSAHRSTQWGWQDGKWSYSTATLEILDGSANTMVRYKTYSGGRILDYENYISGFDDNIRVKESEFEACEDLLKSFEEEDCD